MSVTAKKGEGNPALPASEVPMYRVRAPCFIAPHYLREGAVIRTTGEAGSHLEPLNDAAKAKMEEWYDKEYTVTDERGNVSKVRLNTNKRPAQRAAIQPARVALVADPPRQTEADVVPAVNRDLQPDLVPGGQGTLELPTTMADEPLEDESNLSFDEGTEVVSNPEPVKTPIKVAR